MEWSSELAYAVGLIATDGSLSKDGRHINLTSKDLQQITNFAGIFGLTNKVGLKKSTYNPDGKYYFLQFGNIEFYRFLLEIGLTTNKTKSIGALKIPDVFFADFLRGSLDGDGYTYSYWDKRWASSFLIYTGFVSASKAHIDWISGKVFRLYGIRGHIGVGKAVFQLRFGKRGSVVLLNKMYYKKNLVCLERKYVKIQAALDTIDKEYAGMLK